MPFFRPFNVMVIYIVLVVMASFVHASQEKPWPLLTPKEIFSEHDARALAEAGASGDIRKINELVHSGVNINSQGLHGLTPLFSALVAQNKKGVEQLLIDGADPNLRADDGTAEIHTAAELINAPVFLKLILVYGGDPNLRGLNNGQLFDGQVPLHFVITSNRSALVKIKLLLDAGANIDAQDKNGITPLMWACDGYRFDAAYELLKRGADYSLKTNTGATVVSFLKDPVLLDARPEQKPWYKKVIQFLKERNVDIHGK